MVKFLKNLQDNSKHLPVKRNLLVSNYSKKGSEAAIISRKHTTAKVSDFASNRIAPFGVPEWIIIDPISPFAFEQVHWIFKKRLAEHIRCLIAHHQEKRKIQWCIWTIKRETAGWWNNLPRRNPMLYVREKDLIPSCRLMFKSVGNIFNCQSAKTFKWFCFWRRKKNSGRSPRCWFHYSSPELGLESRLESVFQKQRKHSSYMECLSPTRRLTCFQKAM